ncbi:hypothetical protein SAMN05216429_108178 [Marinobacter persicus]|uniref:Flagellar assembly T-like protein n=1 Tax=Marinobacter persicus TaxID=930118 RepID=A0A1I3VUA7_9GAMM|nr:flagellar assembly protein T N-terminal domain-containing protein [Marinobacter persicus]GHD50158.1 hypothetical protein GCM10008110_20590 [Marinobacter persicus]SFJ99004.1 hypothetical protein SAMN05216429_108178 [Marinobacter persicus]
MKILISVLLALVPTLSLATVLEGVGHATIQENNLDKARAEARKAAMRDLALQYDARISARDEMENGELVTSTTEMSAVADIRNATVVDEYRSGNLLRVTVRGELSEAGSENCKAGKASGLRKRVAVTGFPMVDTAQGGNRSVDDAGEKLPQALVARLQQRGNMQVLGSSRLQLFERLPDAPTSRSNKAANQLTNVVQVARELGAQFVVSGVIRDIGLADPTAWGSSIVDKMQRGIGFSDTERRFEVEMMVFDGFSGAAVHRQRFVTSADWEPDGNGSGGFDSAGFEKSEWGQAVSQVMDQMAMEVSSTLNCQPFMARIARVDGNKVTLESGATAGLRPGDELAVYRSQRYFDALGATPELKDAGVSLTLDNVHPDFSNGTMPSDGRQINIQRDDIAIIW